VDGGGNVGKRPFPFDCSQGQDDDFLDEDLEGAGNAEALAELGGGFAVAEKAERAEIVEVALAAAFGYRSDVVGVPEAAAGCDGLHAVEAEASGANGASGSLEGVVGGDGVDGADGADAAVAGEDLVAEVAGVGAEAPLVNAVVAAEGAAAFGKDFEFAPAAERQAVGTERESLTRGAPTGEGARDDHPTSEDRVRRQPGKLLSLVLFRFQWAGPVGLGSDFEVYFQGIDEGNEPGKKLKVDGMVCVGV
jgi:hypothetical protein